MLDDKLLTGQDGTSAAVRRGAANTWLSYGHGTRSLHLVYKLARYLLVSSLYGELTSFMGIHSEQRPK